MSGPHREDGRSSYSRDSNDRNLPPIREVFRDELGRPAQPSAYSFRDVQNALPTPGSASQRPPGTHGYAGYPGRSEQLPPIQQYGVERSSHAADARRPSGRAPPLSQHAGRGGRDYVYGTDDPGYAYGVLRTSGTSGSLTDATPPSDRPQGILRQTAAPAREDPEDLSKRYKCDYCGKRFGMPSHFQIHIRSHTAQKPFACEWPGCDRTFSVRSNMTRHLRTHDKQKGSRQQAVDRSRYADDDDDDTGGEQEASSSSQYFHTSSAGSSRPSAQFYTSSHRK